MNSLSVFLYINIHLHAPTKLILDCLKISLVSMHMVEIHIGIIMELLQVFWVEAVDCVKVGHFTLMVKKILDECCSVMEVHHLLFS